MKKITSIFIVAFLVLLSIFSCSSNESERDVFSGTSLNVSSAISDIISEFSDNSINESAASLDISSDSYENNSSAPELSAPAESTPDTFVPEENNAESSDESDNENSFDNESDDLSDTSSDVSSEPTHTCSFVKGKTTNPTCTEKGYTIYSCSCGKSEKRDYTSALGHIEGEWETVKEATTSSTGLKQIKCTRCGTVLEEETIAKLVSDEDKYNVPATAKNTHLVEERVLYYLNQYRIAEGTPEATFLWNGKTYKYAKARAEQLVTNFAHDTEDIRKVCTELEFGYYHPTVEYFYDDEGNLLNVIERDEAYYSGGCSEAITGPYFGYRTIDDMAQDVAANIYLSKTHWSYVGAATTIHITIGAYTTHMEYGKWYFCIATSSSDQYD